MKNFSLVAVLFLIIGISACSDSPSNSEPEGNSVLPGYFAGKAGVDQNSQHYEELNGSARFTLSVMDTTFNLAFSSASGLYDTTNIVLRIKSTDLPNEGTYSLNNIDEINQIYREGYSLFYYSALTSRSEIYYSESGQLTIEAKSETGIKGTLEGTVFKKAYIGKDEYVRQYSTINLDFNAIPGNMP
ncbi:MAG: hypothetical protein NXI08_00480 [bacterium]|nr:hypothetical protein [bacterium]